MKVKKLVIPVAGMGTRFLPVTKSLPKEMLPIVDVPTIQVLLEEANVVGTPGVGFGPSGEGYFRLTAFGTKENTIEAIERIKMMMR